MNIVPSFLIGLAAPATGQAGAAARQATGQHGLHSWLAEQADSNAALEAEVTAVGLRPDLQHLAVLAKEGQLSLPGEGDAALRQHLAPLGWDKVGTGRFSVRRQ